MSNLDELLRRSLHDAGTRFDRTVADPGDTVMQRYHRRMTARALASGTLAVALVAGLAVGFKLSRNGSVEPVNDPPVVPWVSTSPAAPPSSAGSVQAAPAGVPDCRSDQLAARVFAGHAATGHTANQIVFANVSRTECALEGIPSVTLNTTTGTTPAQKGGTFFPDSGDIRVDLQPGRTVPSDNGRLEPGYAQLLFEWTDCDSRNSVRSLTVAPKGQPEIAVAGVGVISRSNLAVCDGTSPPPASIGVNHFDGFPRASGAPAWTRLEATLDAPSAAPAGTRLRYTVTLTNGSDGAISLSPCPSYVESLDIRGAKAVERYTLNCSSVHEVAAHASVVFEMYIRVPKTASPGRVKLTWVAEGFISPAGSTSITIT